MNMPVREMEQISSQATDKVKKEKLNDNPYLPEFIFTESNL